MDTDTVILQSSWRVYLFGSLVTIGGFMFGYQTVVSPPTLDTHKNENIANFCNTTASASSITDNIVVVTLLIGCAIGSFATGVASVKFSRKHLIIISSGIFICGVIVQAVSYVPSVWFFIFVGRFISGLAIGALSVLVPVYQSEIATYSDRGKLVSFFQLSITLGIATCFWIEYALYKCEEQSYGFIPTLLQIIPALILCFAGVTLPLSPRWLMSKNRENTSEALQILQKLRKKESQNSDIQAELDGMQREFDLEHESTRPESSQESTRLSIRHRLILGIGIQIFAQLTGINIIMYYGSDVFEFASLDNSPDKAKMNGIIGSINIFFTIVAIFCVEKIGRRILLISGTIVMGISMFVIGVTMGATGYSHDSNSTTVQYSIVISNKHAFNTIITFICIFVAAFAVSMGPIHWIYCSEIFPLTKRATGTSLATSAHWFGSVIIALITPWLLREIWFGTYLIFSFLCFMISILIYLFYPETKGFSLEKMDELFGGPIFVRSFRYRRLTNDAR